MTIELQNQSSSGITGGVTAVVDIKAHSHSEKPPELVIPAATQLPVGQFQDLSDTQHLIVSKPGMFWCYTHLQDLLLEKQSSDPRYCQQCFELLVQESKELSGTHRKQRPWWLPAIDGMHKKTSDVVLEGGVNLSTLNDKNNTVDKLDTPAPVRPIVHPGPKNKVLPMDLIKQLVDEGAGSKVIAKRLTTDGYPVSYKTIQRLLKKGGSR